MGGGLESRCVGRVCGADGAVSHGTIRTAHTFIFIPSRKNNSASNRECHRNTKVYKSATENISVLNNQKPLICLFETNNINKRRHKNSTSYIYYLLYAL